MFPGARERRGSGWCGCCASRPGQGGYVDELRAGRPFGGGGDFPSPSRVCLFLVFLLTYSGCCLFLQGLSGTNVYFTNHHEGQARSHTLSIVFIIPNHHKPSSPSLILHWGWYLSHKRVRNWRTKLGTEGPAVTMPCHADDNPRMDENGASNCLAPYDRPTQTPGLGPCLACVCTHVPPDLPSPSRPPYPPNRRVAGCHCGGMGRGDVGYYGGRGCGWKAGWRNPTEDYGSSDAGARFKWQHHPLRAKSLGFLCLPCLPACQPGTPCPLPLGSCAPSISWNSRLAVGSRSGWREGGGGSQWAGEIHPDGGIRGPPRRLGAGETGHWGVCRTWWWLNGVTDACLLVPCVAITSVLSFLKYLYMLAADLL